MSRRHITSNENPQVSQIAQIFSCEICVICGLFPGEAV